MHVNHIILFSLLSLVQNQLALSWTENIDAVLIKKEKQAQALAQKKKMIHQLLYSCDAAQGFEYLITRFEWRELAISEYVRIFDRTRTMVGAWGLEQLTKPVVHLEVIKERQEGIARIVNDQNKLHYYDMLFADLKTSEDDLFAYFDEHDRLNQDAEQLYYSYFKSVLNASKFALDCAYMVDTCNAVTNIASLVCLTGLMTEFVVSQVSRTPMNMWLGIKKGLSGIFREHSFDDSMYQQYKAKNAFAVARVQMSADEPVRQAGMFGAVSHAYTLAMGSIESFSRRMCDALGKPAVAQTLFYGSFGDKWSYFKEQASMGTSLAFLWVLGQTAYRDHRLWLSVQQNYTRLVFLYTTHNALQQRMCGVARWCKKAHDLLRVAHSIDALRQHPIIQRAAALYADNASEKVKKLLKLLQASTFNQKSRVCYSRGQVLITHALLCDIKQELVPLMQAVGLIDGYISICRVYKAYKDDPEHPFCLVRLFEKESPEIDVVDAWLPLIAKNQVHNSISLGGVQARNMILTGPNGGGKSSVLRLTGGVAVLAQSWGIVPARSCAMTVFSGLRTSFNPPEDISQDLSTFMAQKKRLDQLRSYARSLQPTGQLLLLIDEPYRGTIEAEAEKRACSLGGELAQYGHCMTVIASHLRTPIDLAQSGDFINRHLKIVMDGDAFVRTFKLCDGVAWWWFDDIERRIRFIDWLHAGV